MELLRRAVGLLNSRRDAFANDFEPRQETSSSSSSSASSTSKSAAAAATDASTTSSTSSKAAASAATSATPSLSAGPEQIITKFVSTPAFTATKTTAYRAPGVNGTSVTHSGTSTGTSTYTASEYLATANASAPGIPGNELTACQINGTLANNGPFCSPIHEQELWVGYTYAITWNPALFPNNASDAIVLKYNDKQKGVIWDSSEPNQKGFANINMDKSWLMGAPGNDSTSGQNLTFYLYSGPDNMTMGPMISLVVNPATLPRVLLPKLPTKYGLEVGLPVGIVAAMLIILAIWCGMRKHDRSWKDIKGHGKDYMSRRQRRRGRKGKDGGIQLEEMSHPRNQDAFSDEPYTGGSGNAFRDEVARQREEDDRYRGNITSF